MVLYQRKTLVFPYYPFIPSSGKRRRQVQAPQGPAGDRGVSAHVGSRNKKISLPATAGREMNSHDKVGAGGCFLPCAPSCLVQV